MTYKLICFNCTTDSFRYTKILRKKYLKLLRNLVVTPGKPKIRYSSSPPDKKDPRNYEILFAVLQDCGFALQLFPLRIFANKWDGPILGKACTTGKVHVGLRPPMCRPTNFPAVKHRPNENPLNMFVHLQLMCDPSTPVRITY